MDMQSFWYAVVALSPCFLLGLYFSRRKGPLSRMSEARIMDTGNSHWWRNMICLIVSLLALVLAWALLVAYFAFKPDSQTLLLPMGILALQLALIVVLAGMLTGRMLRWVDAKEEEEKYLHGEGTGY